MDREKKIIAKILSDAEQEKNLVLEKAKQDASDFLKQKEAEEKEFLQREKEVIKENFDKLVEKEKDVTFVEKTKEILKAKQNILLEIFDLALEKLKNLPAKDYKQFIKNVLENNAENGDEIIVSNKEKDKDIIQKLAVFKSKKLKISNEHRSFSGGVIIVNKMSEKDFSFEGLLENKYQQSLIKISKRLF